MTLGWTAFDEARHIGMKMEADKQSFEGRINVYACTPPIMPGSSMKSGCGYWIVTVDREPGVTPMFVRCGHCGGTASSRMYKVSDGLEPTHEWFRPKSEAELPEGYSLRSVEDHLRNGGLLLRPIGKDEWLAPTPETLAFMKSEMEFFAKLRPPVPTGRETRQQRRHAARQARK